MQEVLLRLLGDEQDKEGETRLPRRQRPVGTVVTTGRYGHEPELEDVWKQQQQRALAGDLERDLADHPVAEQHKGDDALKS